jgi:hypothetical protein
MFWLVNRESTREYWALVARDFGGRGSRVDRPASAASNSRAQVRRPWWPGKRESGAAPRRAKSGAAPATVGIFWDAVARLNALGYIRWTHAEEFASRQLPSLKSLLLSSWVRSAISPVPRAPSAALLKLLLLSRMALFCQSGAAD